MLPAAQASDTVIGDSSKFMAQRFGHMKHGEAPDALSHRNGPAEHGPTAYNSQHADANSEHANHSHMPIGMSAIGVSLLTLAAMLGARMRRGLQQATNLVSSGGHESNMSVALAPASADNILELKMQGSTFDSDLAFDPLGLSRMVTSSRMMGLSRGADRSKLELQASWKSIDRRQLASGLAGLAGAVAAPPAQATVFLDPARYGDQELKNAAIAKCRTRVRDVIAKDPSTAANFFLLALLDGLSYDEKTKRGGPDGTVAASIQLPGRAYDELKDAVDILQESQKALKRTNALTLADLIALSGAEALAAVGGPEISVQLGRTDNPKLLDAIKSVSKGGLREAEALGIAPAFDVENGTPSDVIKAFRRSGFTEREAAALLGALAVLQGDEVVNAKPVKNEEREQGKQRGKIARGKAANTNFVIDTLGTNEGTEEASVDKFEGDVDDFYIADAFGSRKEAYGRRVGGASSSVENFNKVFIDLMAAKKKGISKGSSTIETALLSDQNVEIWVQKYAAERLTFLKDLDKSLYRITQVGAQYTGGKYAALLDNKPVKKLSSDR